MNRPDDHVLEYVDAYMHDGLLSAREHERVAAHCEECPICRVALDEARRRKDALQSLPPAEASELLIRQTLARVERQQVTGRKWIRGVLFAAAAAVLTLVSVHIYYYNLAPSPYDLRLMGQTDLLSGADASLRVVVFDTRSASPRQDVPVAIDLIGDKPKSVFHLASFRTDRYGSGTVRMAIPDWTPGRYQLRVTAQPDGRTEAIEEAVTLRRSWQLMLSSDKPVYQPGQTIRLRSLALARPQGKPVAGQEAVFSITDPKGNVIFRQRNVTSRYGITSADCPLATEILEGPYQIRCELGDTPSTITVEVKKYVLPKFKIAVELDKPYYQPGQKVRGTVSANYFFGKPASHAAVNIDVDGGDIGRASLATITVKTDAQGKAAFDFTLPPSLVGRPQDGGDARIKLAITVSDEAGQTQSLNVSRLVTAQPIRIEVIPEAGKLVDGLPNTVYFLTTYADGRPAATRITVSGFDRELVTSPMGAASLRFTPLTNEAAWVVRATDAAGLTARRDVNLGADASDGRFLVRTDKAVYRGGETIRVTALGGGGEPIFLDVIRDGQTVLTDTIAMTNGHGEYALDLAPELSGAIQICGYRFGLEGLSSTQTRVIYVRPAGQLKIETRLDRPEYRPGQQAQLAIAVTDLQGRPVPGAVSLAAVDEAVYSVIGAAPGMQPPLTSLEQELLKPVYAIYPWSPDMDAKLPAAQRDEFERALFAHARLPANDRDAVLRELIGKYGENSQSILRVFERPDWEELAKNIDGLEKFMPLLKGQHAVHSLRESTYPKNAHAVESLRRERLDQIAGIWTVLVVGSVIAVVIALVIIYEKVASFLVVIMVIGFLLALMIPAVHSAREAGRRASAINDLKMLDLTLESAKADRNDAFEPKQSPAAPPRVREWFPETLFWRPEVITDDQGRASLAIDLADSITTWRVSAGAVSAEGQLGGAEASIRVFQPFFVDLNLPFALTRGDEVSAPAVVYNYLDKPLTVELRLDDGDWFERIDPAAKKLELSAGEVRSVSYSIRVRRVGHHELTLHAAAGDVADAVKRTIEVAADGRPVTESASGTLQQPAEIPWNVPSDAIDGSVKAIVKLYPSTFSQLVDGLESIFRLPYGCFEQTSSTTYPNVLALDYLRRTKKSVPQVEATARQYIHLGCQRLLSFEISGGGFDWFGHPPANRTLTAYGLMEFVDMARVHDVDPRLIERTRRWLLDQQNEDGSWSPESHSLHEDPTAADRDLQQLSTTAYIAWSVFGDGKGDPVKARAAADYLRRHEPAAIDDPYVLTLVARGLLAASGNEATARPYLARLEAMSRGSADGKLVWWEPVRNSRTMFYGGGPCAAIETTALAALAMIEGHANPTTVRGALAWLVAQKDEAGTWHSTQSTVLSLKALLAGTDRPLGEAQPRQIEIAVDGKTVETLSIPGDQGDVMRQVDLSRQITAGSHRLTLREPSGTATGYLASLVYHVPTAARPAASDSLAIELHYDKTSLAVDDHLTATATLTNRMAEVAPMVILDLPIPAGFAAEATDLAALRDQGKLAKYQVTPRRAIVYLRGLEPNQPITLTYRLRATIPVKIVAPAARAYEYYNPAHQAASDPVSLRVVARK